MALYSHISGRCRCGPSDLLLTLDALSAEATNTVVWDVIRRYIRSWNTCFVKSGRLGVHLGLDHATSEPRSRASSHRVN